MCISVKFYGHISSATVMSILWLGEIQFQTAEIAACLQAIALQGGKAIRWLTTKKVTKFVDKIYILA